MAEKTKLKKEEEFHDGWAKSMNLKEVLVDEFFEACTAPENRLILKKIGRIKGKKILEVGCGAGEASVYFAKKGADVTATDLSGGMLEVVKKLAKMHKTNLKTKQCPSDDLPFKDSTFDVVYVANLLHHVEHEPTLRECFRVLKKGGLFVSWDPLAHNPILNIYRKMATEVRTEDETPLKMKDVKKFRMYASKVEYSTTWFFTLWIFIKFYLFERVHPNEERYWKKILIEHKRLERTYKRLDRFDRFFLRMFPFLRRYCWNLIIFARK